MKSRLPPGFRFYPSDEELVCFYLRKKVTNERVSSGTLVEVDLHAREPWELPEVAKLTADEWYFFSFRDRKYATGSRTNRATKTGYWKATGKDRVVHETTVRATVGMRKTLVFHRGRAPNGHKTSWVMHEFRLETPNSPPKEDWVLCRVFNKQRKASEAEQVSNSNSNHAVVFAAGRGTAGPSSPTALLGSSPDPTVVDKFDHHQIAAAMGSSSSTRVPLMHGHGDHMISGHCSSSSSSSSALLNLAMLQYSFPEYCPGPAMHDNMAVGGSNTGCCAGSNDAMMELELGQHVGFEEHGMGEIIEMEMEPQGGGSCYRDGLYF